LINQRRRQATTKKKRLNSPRDNEWGWGGGWHTQRLRKSIRGVGGETQKSTLRRISEGLHTRRRSLGDKKEGPHEPNSTVIRNKKGGRRGRNHQRSEGRLVRLETKGKLLNVGPWTYKAVGGIVASWKRKTPEGGTGRKRSEKMPASGGAWSKRDKAKQTIALRGAKL